MKESEEQYNIDNIINNDSIIFHNKKEDKKEEDKKSNFSNKGDFMSASSLDQGAFVSASNSKIEDKKKEDKKEEEDKKSDNKQYNIGSLIKKYLEENQNDDGEESDLIIIKSESESINNIMTDCVVRVKNKDGLPNEIRIKRKDRQKIIDMILNNENNNKKEEEILVNNYIISKENKKKMKTEINKQEDKKLAIKLVNNYIISKENKKKMKEKIKEEKKEEMKEEMNKKQETLYNTMQSVLKYVELLESDRAVEDFKIDIGIYLSRKGNLYSKNIQLRKSIIQFIQYIDQKNYFKPNHNYFNLKMELDSDVKILNDIINAQTEIQTIHSNNIFYVNKKEGNKFNEIEKDIYGMGRSGYRDAISYAENKDDNTKEYDLKSLNPIVRESIMENKRRKEEMRQARNNNNKIHNEKIIFNNEEEDKKSDKNNKQNNIFVYKKQQNIIVNNEEEDKKSNSSGGFVSANSLDQGAFMSATSNSKIEEDKKEEDNYSLKYMKNNNKKGIYSTTTKSQTVKVERNSQDFPNAVIRKTSRYDENLQKEQQNNIFLHKKQQNNNDSVNCVCCSACCNTF